jgi:phytoene synthase
LSWTASELEEAHRACAREVRLAAGNFYYAFRLLPRLKRQALHSVYQFCRGADDIADGDGSAEQRRLRLEDYRRALDLTINGRPPDPGWLTLADSVQRFDLSPGNLNEVIDGCAADCAPMRITTESALARYCYGVAGSVGILSARIFGYHDQAVPALAVRLGQAMQLTNILRDLKEDFDRERCYLPDEDLDRFGLDHQDLVAGLRGPRAAGYVRLMGHEIERARAHFEVGTRLVPLVARDARGCPAALAALYRAILSEIERRGFDVQTERVSISAPRKVRLAVRAWGWATLAT